MSRSVQIGQLNNVINRPLNERTVVSKQNPQLVPNLAITHATPQVQCYQNY